jgi:hypothetical protein
MAPSTPEEFRDLAALARRLENGLLHARTLDRLHQVAAEYEKEAADLTAGTRAETDRLGESRRWETRVLRKQQSAGPDDVQTAFFVRA